MRILSVGMLDPAETPGGLDRYRTALEGALVARGNELRALCGGTASAPGVFHPGSPLLTVKRAGSAARTLMAGWRFDLVATHFALSAAGCWLAENGRHPWVMHFHGPWAREAAVEEQRYGWRYHLRRQIELRVYRRATAVITLSHAFAEIVRRDYGVDPGLISVIPPGVDLARFCPGDRNAARAQFGIPSACFVFLTVRRLALRMGLETLIRAAAQLRAGPWCLLIAGDGGLRSALQQQIAQAGVGDRVRLLGRVDESRLPELYRTADLFVMPSEELEGFGMVIPEALATGVPVLATPVGGIPEALEGLPGALLPRAGDPNVLAGAMDAIRAGRISLPPTAQLRHFAEQRYDWARAAARVEEVYRAACVLRRGRPRHRTTDQRTAVASLR